MMVDYAVQFGGTGCRKQAGKLGDFIEDGPGCPWEKPGTKAPDTASICVAPECVVRHAQLESGAIRVAARSMSGRGGPCLLTDKVLSSKVVKRDLEFVQSRAQIKQAKRSARRFNTGRRRRPDECEGGVANDPHNSGCDVTL